MRRDVGFAAFAILIVGPGYWREYHESSASSTPCCCDRCRSRSPSEAGVELRTCERRTLGQTPRWLHAGSERRLNRPCRRSAGYFAFYVSRATTFLGRASLSAAPACPSPQLLRRPRREARRCGRTFDRARRAVERARKRCMLGYALWERRFNSDPKIVGTVTSRCDQHTVVVGVLPPRSTSRPSSRRAARRLVRPFPLSPETNRWGNTMAMIGRLKRARQPPRRAPGGTVTQPQKRLHPERNGFEAGSSSTPLASRSRGAIPRSPSGCSPAR